MEFPGNRDSLKKTIQGMSVDEWWVLASGEVSEILEEVILGQEMNEMSDESLKAREELG